MTTQPTALRLADAMSLSFPGNLGIDKAAAELRRLSAENEALRRERDANLNTINVDNAIITRLSAQRDALLEALRWIADRCPVHLSDHPLHNIHKEMSHDAGARARAAIKAAEGEKT